MKHNQGGFPVVGTEGHGDGLWDRHALAVPTRTFSGSLLEHLHGLHFRRHVDHEIESMALPFNETANLGNAVVLRATL